MVPKSVWNLSLIFFAISLEVFPSFAAEGTANNVRTVRSAKSSKYQGEWDISGKHTAMLCDVLRRGQTGGGDVELTEPSKHTYLKDGKCWKNQWIPCENDDEDDRLAPDGILSKRRKPCGHYKMVSDSDC